MTIWTVPATVVRVSDADTVVMNLDLGFGVHMPAVRCRLSRVNAPEIKTPEGIAAAAFTREWLSIAGTPIGAPVTFVSRRLDNYGRPLGEVIRLDKRNLSDDLLDAGHAVPM